MTELQKLRKLAEAIARAPRGINLWPLFDKLSGLHLGEMTLGYAHISHIRHSYHCYTSQDYETVAIVACRKAAGAYTER